MGAGKIEANATVSLTSGRNQTQPLAMVKRSLARKAELAPRKAENISRDGGIGKDALPMHRGRKKRLEAKRRLEKKKDFIAAEIERLHGETEKKRAELRKQNAVAGPLGPALAVMGDIADALPSDQPEDEEVSAKDSHLRALSRTPKFVRHKERRRIVVAETAQLNNVREHPVFKENPIETLRQHLMNTVSAHPSEIPPPLAPGDAGASKKKKKVKGGGGEKEAKRPKPDFELGNEEAEKIREEAKQRLAAKREQKAAFAEAAAKLKRKKQGGKIEKQTLKGLMSRPRGRIGVKRPKI